CRAASRVLEKRYGERAKNGKSQILSHIFQVYPTQIESFADLQWARSCYATLGSVENWRLESWAMSYGAVGGCQPREGAPMWSILDILCNAITASPFNSPPASANPRQTSPASSNPRAS
ncbi:hypothetical protein O988_05335, partial [Pseudogymnoascus sp. VKM F-3808]